MKTSKRKSAREDGASTGRKEKYTTNRISHGEGIVK